MPRKKTATVIVELPQRDIQHDIHLASFLDMFRYCGLIDRSYQEDQYEQFPYVFAYESKNADQEIERWKSYSIDAHIYKP